MAKQSGLGDAAFVGGYDLSSDVLSLSKIGGGPAVLDVTPINASAHVRIGGLRDGEISFTTAFDNAANAEHVILSTLPTTDTMVSYYRGTAIGNPAANIVAKQINYDPTRATDGMLTVAVQSLANGFGLEWGTQLTPGLRTDTSATAGSSYDQGAGTTFGLQAYLQVTAFSGTDVTVKIQHSTDNSTFTDLSGGGFTAITAAHTFQRIATSNSATINRYLKATTTTSGGFTSVTFAVAIVINALAGQVF